MKQNLTFDDVLILPNFSYIDSRSKVDLHSFGLKLPIISANMDTITGPEMANAMTQAGGIGCLHRFSSIEENVKMFNESNKLAIVSIGLGKNELERAEALYANGARSFCIDVAHGAQASVVHQLNELIELLPGINEVIVGNFATSRSIYDFMWHSKKSPTAFKVGIGPGSACTTRIKTGVGMPQLSAIMDCAKTGHNIIADGGMKTPGDIAKAFAAGATAVMLGGMLSGAHETPGKIVDGINGQSIEEYMDKDSIDFLLKNGKHGGLYKKYRGSASKESYEAQGKNANHRTAEGESFLVPYKGSVSNILQDIEGGLRSAMTYVGASNMEEFSKLAEFTQITGNGLKENGAHGKG